MKLIRRIGRNLRDAFKSVIRNFSLSLSSISCITITLIVVMASIVMSYNVENFTENISKDVTIVVFVDSEVTGEALTKYEEKINNIENIDKEKTEYVSKEQAAENFKNDDPIFEVVMEEWGEEDNPLLDSYKLKVHNIEKIKETADRIEGFEETFSVSYGEEIVTQLVTVFNAISNVTFWLVIALVLVTAFLITNTIKLTIFSRQREIEIMRLVGASNSSIKMPFVIEGLFLGVIGSIIPIIITIYGYMSLYDFFGGKLLDSNLAKLIVPTPFVYIVSLLLLLIGIFVGMFGSWTASRKYLKI